MTAKRALGASGITTVPLMLGGNVFGWTADEAASFAVLDRFVERGGTLIDTADVYSAWAPGHRGGESETVIGAWLRRSGARVQVATKVGKLAVDGKDGLRPEVIAKACDASLKRLGVERIDLYFAHADDANVPLADTMGAFDALVKAGKVGAVGASNYSAERLGEALAASDGDGLARFSVLQPEYNLLSRGEYEGALQALCVAENIGVVPYFGLASGYLSGKYRTAADLAKSARGQKAGGYMKGRGPEVLAAMDAVAAETGAGLPAIALAWLAAKPGITAPIASATSAEQLDDVMASLDLSLTPEQMARLDDALN